MLPVGVIVIEPAGGLSPMTFKGSVKVAVFDARSVAVRMTLKRPAVAGALKVIDQRPPLTPLTTVPAMFDVKPWMPLLSARSALTTTVPPAGTLVFAAGLTFAIVGGTVSRWIVTEVFVALVF